MRPSQAGSSGDEMQPTDGGARGQHQEQLARVEAQVATVRQMLSQNASCYDVLAALQVAEQDLAQITRRMAFTHAEECMSRLPPETARTELERTLRLLIR